MGLGDFFGDAWDKAKSQVTKTGQFFTLPLGATMDLARYATPLDNDAGPDWLGVKDSLGGLSDTLLGEGTLTGWSITKVGEAANDVYRNVLENPVEALYYAKPDGVIDTFTGRGEAAMSWSDAWGLAKERNFGQTLQLATNDLIQGVDDRAGTSFGKFVQDNPLASPAGVGATANRDIDPRSKDAWTEFQKASPFFSGAAASSIDIGAQFAADPFLLVTKATQVPRTLRNLRPILEGEEVGLAERMAGEKTHKVLGVPSRKAGLQSRTDPLIGTVKYDDHIVDGKPVLDADGAPVKVAAPGAPGWLDGKSPAQVYTGLGLKSHAYGDEVATLLSRTNEITNPADKVNVRRDILASMGGDAAANARLAAAADTKEFAYTLSNAYRGRGTGELEVAFADEAATASGKVGVTHAEPDVVAGVLGELKAQRGFDEWLYGSMKERTLVTSPKGNRALARLAGQGVGRDGTLRTGYTGFDDIVNDKVLGRFKPDGSVLDNAIAQSDELAEGAPLRDAKVYQADQVSFSRGPNSQPATIARAGLKVAGWATVTPFIKGTTKASDALRGRVVQGALNVEDAPLSIAVTQDFLRRAGVEGADVDRLTSSVVDASGPSARAQAVREAEAHAVKTLANKYGVDEDLIARLSERHSERQSATMASLRGQSFSAHTKVDGSGEIVAGDVAYLPDDNGTAVMPILDTQTINNLPLLDLDYVQKWLKRDQTLSSVGSLLRNAGSNPSARRATEMGFNSRVTQTLEKNSERFIRHFAEETNAWWKRSVLLTRAPSYAMRNSAEEMMRVASISHTAVTADTAARHAAQRAADFARRKGLGKNQDMAPEFARLELRKSELEDLRDLHDDPEIVENVKAIRQELRRLRTQHTKAWNAGDVSKADELRSAIEFTESMPMLTEHQGWADDIINLERDIAGLTKSLDEPVLPDSGFRQLAGFGDTQFPQAFQGVGGKMAYERVAGGGTFDKDVTEFGERLFSRRRGVGEQSILNVSHPSVQPDEVARHMQAWNWVLNKQIRQDPAARIALRGMADGADDIESQVLNFLDSPAGATYRKNNPHRAHDTEEWAGDIADTVKHNAHDSALASRLLDNEVSKDELAELFPEVNMRPDVHPAGVDGLVGAGNRKFANFAGRSFQRIDKMSVNALTRHPLFTAFFQEEQGKLASDFARKAQLEMGEGATLSVDDINNITERARKVAQTKVKQTFYDTSSRSSAAQKLRFIYPFFGAHQDSMAFWGKAVMNNPNVLREFQLAFQVPASLGLVVDQDGNEVKPGTFVSNDHVVLLQVPKSWGGPDPKDPTAKGNGFRLPLSSANLITQNGSILNPGAGPMAAIPAGYVQRKWGAKDDELSHMLTWFNPFGAPKSGDSPALPGLLQDLDPALPTPVKRLATLWDAHTNENSREYTEMFALRFQEAQVKFYEDNDRPPNTLEAAKLEKDVTGEVKQMAWLRLISSVASPAQPQPTSRRQGFINEFRKLQEIGRNEGRGPFWATDTFLDKYGDAYMALTKSSSENRSYLDPTSATVRTLDRHSKLADKVAPETWRLIVAGEGEGAFSMDAYRWMQDKNVGKVFGGGKLIDKKDVKEQLFNNNTAAGWREFNKYKNILMATATDNGYPSIDKSPQLVEMKRAMVKDLSEKFPDWYSEYSSGGDSDYETKYLPSIRTIVADKGLRTDPAREDIRQLDTYVQGRDAVLQVLSQRDAAGGSADIDAQSNADVAMLFSMLVDQLSESNTWFSDYAVDGIISRDPIYRAGLKAGGTS